MSSGVKQKNSDDGVFFDPSKRAEAILDHVLDTELSIEAKSGPKVSVSDALRSRPILDSDTGRNKARVVFVTTDESALVKGSLQQNEYQTLSKLFDEFHVLVLIGRSGKDSFERAGSNLWVYRVHQKHWWRLPKTSLKAARAALTFNGSVRPDVIVGVDPFEAGLGAYYIARDFERPLQIHIKTNFLTANYSKLNKGNWWRVRMAKNLLKRVASVRTATANLKDILFKRYPKISDLEVLPRFYNFAGLAEAQPAFDLHQKYKDFVLVILAFGPLTADSHLHDLFSALRKTLLNQRIGLIVVGDGPAKSLFEEKVKLLGIEKSVVFKKQAEDLASYLKTANLLVQTDISSDSEMVIMQAAAAGLPIVAFETELRLDLFEDGKSALLCKPKDLLALSQKVTYFINNLAIRSLLKSESQAMASARLQENAEGYYQAYQETIERILFTAEAVEEVKSTNTATAPLEATIATETTSVDSILKQA